MTSKPEETSDVDVELVDYAPGDGEGDTFTFIMTPKP